MKGIRLKKGLCLVLCGVLLLMSLGLSDFGSLKSYADTPLQEVGNYSFELTLPYTPVCGEDITDLTGQDVQVTSHSNCTAKIAEAWHNTSDEKFVGGKDYQVMICITAKDGYYFPNSLNGAIVDVVVTNDNGNSAFYGLGDYIDPTDGWNKDRKSIHVWAKFTCVGNPITVSFDGGAGSGSMAQDTTYKEGDTYFFPACEFTPPTGYKFVGWSVNDPNPATGIHLYEADDSIVLYEDKTMYAQYTPKRNYALTINCDPYKGNVVVTDGSNNLDPSAIPEGTYVKLTAQPGSGWKLKTNGWSYPITPASVDEKYLTFYMPASSMTVGYTFEKDSEAKTITLDARGGSVSPSEVMTNKEGKLKLPNGNLITLPTPTAAGKVFKYWATSPEGSAYDPYATYTEDTTLYAVYEDAPAPAPTPTPEALSPCDIVSRMIDAAKPGDTITFDFGGWHSMPLWFMSKVASRPDLTYVFKCEYEYKEYVFTINPGDEFALDCEWYGPLKMVTLFDNEITDENGTVKTKISRHTANAGIYVVQKGDTLSIIAAKLKRTLEELLWLNPDIKDINRIYVGQKLYY